MPTESNPSATVMVSAETGSYYESKRENGLSHFLEHMLFKGTPTRPSALMVSTELDAIGAESNAFTSNEFTAYYAKSEKRHWKKLLDVVSDIFLHPVFPKEDLEKERGVILQEISMYQDLPQRHVWSVLSRLMFGDTPAGRDILGSKENIKGFSRKDFVTYHKKHYVAPKVVVTIAGDVSHKEVVSEVKKIFKSLPKARKSGKEKLKESQSKPALLIEKKKSDQTHMVMAFRAFGSQEKYKTAVLDVLMGILGNGMSSRLFQRLREEMGACYYVRSSNDVYAEHGVATISTGIDKNRIVEVTMAILDECKRLTYEEVSEKELQKIKDYQVSHMYMGLETTDALAGYYTSEEIVHGKARDPKVFEDEIRKVTAKDVLKMAQEVFRDENLNLAVVGNVSDTKGVKKVLTFK